MNKKRPSDRTVETLLSERKRESITRNMAKGIARSAGFTTQEVFRKYLRYKMVEEPFTGAFVEDILALKKACELTPKQMSEIFVRKCYENGEEVRDVDFRRLRVDQKRCGTKNGRQRQMFSKLCYLADCGVGGGSRGRHGNWAKIERVVRCNG